MTIKIRIPDPNLNIYGKSKTKKRKHISSKLRKEKTYTRKKCIWCRKSKVYELHHIDGNRSNSRRSNLIGLCGNCHHRATNGEITKKQLKRRLGIKEKIKKVRKVRRVKRQPAQPKYFWES